MARIGYASESTTTSSIAKETAISAPAMRTESSTKSKPKRHQPCYQVSYRSDGHAVDNGNRDQVEDEVRDKGRERDSKSDHVDATDTQTLNPELS